MVRREELLERTRRVLNRGRRGNPDVLLVEEPTGFIVVKDFAPRSWWVRALWGRLAIARELRAYRALSGHPAVPRLRGRLDAYALTLEYRPGRPLSRRVRRELPALFWDRLDAAVAEMHRRGVVHLDLRHRSNVLVDRVGKPVLIDFGSAQCFREGGLAWRWLLPALARVDRRAVAKWRQRPVSPVGTGASPSSRRGANRPM